MSAEVCGEFYQRPDRSSVRCSFIKGHDCPHSWRTLRLQDEADAERLLGDIQIGTQVSVLLEAVAKGDLDQYLEAILAGCHARKRARRGIWTP